MIYTNLHHTVILGQEYRFQIKGCELECHQRTHGADAAWYPTADPLMLRHLRTVAEDGDRQVLRTRQTADLLRELEQNQTHVDMLKRRNAWIAVELREAEITERIVARDEAEAARFAELMQQHQAVMTAVQREAEIDERRRADDAELQRMIDEEAGVKETP